MRKAPLSWRGRSLVTVEGTDVDRTSASGRQLDTCGAPSAPSLLAALWRDTLDADDRVALGIREHGPLVWEPDDEPQPTTPVERGRLRTLSKRRIWRDHIRRRANRALRRLVAA